MSVSRRWEGHEGPILDSAKGFDVIECGRCGFRHVVPLPTPGELEEVYRQEYYTKEKPLYLERHREDLDWWNLAYGDRYDTFEDRLPPRRRRILDIGSGPGFFLFCGKNRGWTTLGIEPSAQAAAHARGLGLEVVEEFLTEESAGRLGRFDAIHMSEVLEHIPDAAGMLGLANGLLSPGGVICIVAPNDYSVFQGALRTACGFSPWWVAPPHHVNYFDFGSLSRLLEKCGFEVFLREATFPIDLFLLMGDNYVGDDALGRRCHGKRKALELNLARAGRNEVRRALYRAFADHGIGRETVVFAAKKG